MFPIFTSPKYSSPPEISFLKDRNYTQQEWDKIRRNLSHPINDMLPIWVIKNIHTVRYDSILQYTNYYESVAYSPIRQQKEASDRWATSCGADQWFVDD